MTQAGKELLSYPLPANYVLEEDWKKLVSLVHHCGWRESQLQYHLIYHYTYIYIGFAAYEILVPLPGFCLHCRRPGFDPRVWKIPWRRAWLPTPVFLPGEFHGQRSLVGSSPRGRKESDTTEQLLLSLSPGIKPVLSAVGVWTPF